MKGLFGYEIPDKEELKPKRTKPTLINPMCNAYGSHPNPDLKCKDCKHLYYVQFSKRYYKCDYRKDTRGPGTDHRKHWHACKKFEYNQES